MSSKDFLSHLEELRRRLLLCLVVFAVFSALSAFLSREILDFLTLPLRRFSNADLFFQRPYEAFLIRLKVSAFAGFVLASPFFFAQVWLFVAPGLYEKEKMVLFPLIFFSAAFFLAGGIFAYFIIIPFGLHFLLGFQTENLKPLLSVGPYFSFLTGMSLATGLFFDAPIILIGLVHFGILQSTSLAKARRPIIVCIFIAAAVLTPSPDPVSQVILAIPLLLLFEISLLITRWLERKKTAIEI